MSKTPEEIMAEKRILANLQSIAMHAVALQQYIHKIDYREAATLDAIDQDMDNFLAWAQEEEA